LYLTAINNAHHKKAFFALLCSIFCFHDVEEEEKNILRNLAKIYNGEKELKWACNFVKTDILTSFERSKNKVIELLSSDNNDTKLYVLSKVWEATKDKGYINQNEAALLLGIARNWKLEKKFIDLVKVS